MKKDLRLKSIAVALVAMFVGVLLVGCSKDADPQAKIDAPGYYNGPLDKKPKEPSKDSK